MCHSEHDKCPGGAELLQLSMVTVPIAAGVAQTCLNAAVGIRLGSGDVVNIGVDALLLGRALRVLLACLPHPSVLRALPMPSWPASALSFRATFWPICRAVGAWACCECV